MKTFIKIPVILLVVTVIFGCRKEPEIPEPATPKGLSYQVQDGSILFSWFPAKDALSYGMEIATDAELADLVFTKEGIEDTFQLVSCDSFLADSTYHWRVRAEGEAGWGEWSDVASFTYSSGGGLDLDTTYFPFGLGYEWCYEKHKWGWEYGDPGEEWDYYDTFTIKVIDSFWTENTLVFSLDGQFQDVKRSPSIFDGMICVADRYFWCPYDTIPVTVSKDTVFRSPCGLTSSYSGNNLTISIYYEPSMSEQFSDGTERLKGIGVISQSSGSWSPYGSSDEADRLLYFYNGQDTVYKAD